MIKCGDQEREGIREKGEDEVVEAETETEEL